MQQRLAEMGEWLQVNGEAIYDTRSWRDCPEANLKENVYYTVKGDDLYVILTEWQERPFEISGVKKPRNISLLGTDRKIKSSYSGEKLTIMPPVMNFTEVPCQHAWVYKLENVFKK